MAIQDKFDSTIDLLKSKGQAFPFVSVLLDNYKTTELTFGCFDKASTGTGKANLLGIYEIRARIENDRKDNPHVLGYDSLLQNLRQTELEYVCISDFMTNIGSFIVFSDFDRKNLIGVLFLKTTLQQTRNNMDDHKKSIESTGNTVLYDYTKNENVFINGQLQPKHIE